MAYSDEQKAVALAALQANNGDVERTAKFCKLPPSTVRNWAKGKYIPQDVAKKGEEKKELLADKLERLAIALADAAFERMDEAGLQPITTSMAIAIDKMQLLREKPTNITGQYDSPDARKARLAELLAKRSGGEGTPRTPRMGGEGEPAAGVTVQ